MIHELIITIFISLLIVVLRKRKISNLIDIEIKGLPLFVASFLLQFISGLIVKNYYATTIGQFIYTFFPYIHSLSYQLILIGIVLNIEKNYMKLFLIGTLMNFTVILFNGMKMPVRIPPEYPFSWENYSYLAYGKDLIHTALTKDTRLKFLADIIILNDPYPFNKTISIGDIFLLIGFGWFIQEETKKSP
ncbi:MAG: DUF5317 domain-containing protein [Dethiosulfatibacter sp.]|nr:DUF5317 domain-containing protein [Dethiosulfatibacter sp.]